MSTGANPPSCNGPFGTCLNWISPNSPPSPILQHDPELVARTPTEAGTIRQIPPESVLPMVHLVRTIPGNQLEEKPTTAQSEEWKTFGMALKALEKGAEVFPPLQNAVSVLLACTMHIQVAEQNRQDYDQLASDLTNLAQTLRIHLPESKPRRMPHSIENVARAIEAQVAHIEKQQERSGIDQVIRASDNEIDIVGCYRKIESIFRQLQTDVSLSIWDLTHDQWVDTRLKDLNPVHDARYNAGLLMDMQRHGCTPNTRVKILRGTMDWAQDPNAVNIYWMSGMAGTGKTTIAYTLCEQLEASKQLGACFFCSRASPACRDVNRIVPTIAYQLARFSNPYQNKLCDVLSNNPDVAKRDITVQFQKLVVGPLLEVKDSMPTDVIIVIDALDECDDIRGTQLVLELLFRYATSLPVKIFVTSRPEPSISSRINSWEEAYRLILHLHDVEESLVQEDIRLYLADELSSVETKPEDIDRLAVRAGCLFIFAATVVRYIEPHDAAVDHRKRLRTMLGAHTKDKTKLYRDLDGLYLTILSRALGEVKGDEGDTRRLVLRTVLSAREPLTIPTVTELAGLEDEEEVRLALLPLRSVLRVSGNTQIISTLHASFPDFMLDASRSQDFQIDMSEQNAYMATRCFEIMKKWLKFNICNLETSSQPDQDVPNLQIRVNEAVSPCLSYACRYWGDYLYGAKHSDVLISLMDQFLRHRLLSWMEVLNLKDWIGLAASILFRAFVSLPADDALHELRTMLQDSRNFVITYAANPASQSTPHIYISALPLTPVQSLVRKTYWPRMRNAVQVEGTAVKDRADAALATWPTGLGVTRLALSKDGTTLASGDSDGSITLWNISKGRRVLGPLKKHQDLVFALTFSPDGGRVASGSADSTIVIWHTFTGDTLCSLFHGHTASISDLLFSLDGTCLISCSEDRTIRIWDSTTGTQIGSELRGHQEAVMCIVLFSDGEQLVSSSDDHTIRVWNLKTGGTVGEPFEGHTDWVDCVALSPDNKYIASSSRDCTVRVWSLEHRKTIFDPLVGHTDRVWCVAYSPDGQKLVSGSFDQTIRVWSSQTGDLIAGPFWGHGDWVNSVFFSHDGTQIISGSGDGTICIWDANHSISDTSTALRGHTQAILSIALSPNGTRALSGSEDHKICVWDTEDGTLILGPLKGHTDVVWSVAYTPDGACLVSGSVDTTIRTWDANTGLALADPFARQTDGITAVAVSPDGDLVASGSHTGSIRAWRLHCGTELHSFSLHHTSYINSLHFSPNGLYIASGSEDAQLCLWDTHTGSLIRKFEKLDGWVGSARFSPDSQRLVVCSGGALSVWDLDSSTMLFGPWGEGNVQRWAEFSSNGLMIASGAEDETVHLWDAKDGTVLKPPFKGHAGTVFSVAFTPDSKRVVSSSGDRTIRFWDLDSINNTEKQVIDGWETHTDGWIKDSESRLVLWLPPDLARIIRFPPCSLVISSRGSLQANFSKFTYGDQWRDCYSEAPSSDISDL